MLGTGPDAGPPHGPSLDANAMGAQGSPAPARRAALSRRQAAAVMGLLLGLQPLTTDAYLPALPALGRELAAPMSLVQLTMAGLILAFGAAQLAWGPASDRWGRRPVLLAGLALYTAAAFGCVWASSIELLVLWRVLQGAALACAVVCARAMLRDLYERDEGARVMSMALSGLALIAISAPALGGALAGLGGWRTTLAGVAVAGASTLVLIAWRLPETLRQPNPHALRPGPLARQWLAIARHREFVAWTLLLTFSYGGLFVVLAGSPFVYIDGYGLSPTVYGVIAAGSGVAYLLGTLLCRRWVQSQGVIGAAMRGGALALLAGVVLVATIALGGARPPLAALLVPLALFLFSHGFNQPCALAGITNPFPAAAGTAAALAGCVMSAVAFGIGQWLGFALDGSARPLAYGVAFFSVAVAATAWALLPPLRNAPRQRPQVR